LSLKEELRWDHVYFPFQLSNIIQIFHAADNNSVGIFDGQHRLNQAHFFSSLDGSTQICAIDEGRNMFLLGLDGVEVGSSCRITPFNFLQQLQRFDMSSIGGRLRDLSVCSVKVATETLSFATISTSTGKTQVC
jgi:hypothetical protein